MALSLGSLSHSLQRRLNIDRRRTPRDRPVRLGRHRIFILPTRYGLLYAALTFVMLVGATNYNNSTGFLLTFLLIGVGLVSILHTYRNLAGLSVRAGHNDPVFQGDSARYELQVANTGAERCAVGFASGDSAPQFHDLAPDSELRVVIPAPALRRGRLALGTVTLFSRYPLGLFRAWSPVSLDASCIVYPKPSARDWRFLPSGDAGGARARPTPGNDDFSGYRDFRPGDPPRHIDWKAAARGQKLYTKVFADDAGGEVWLDWDDAAGDPEERLSRLCRAVLSADRAGLAYGLRLPGKAIVPGHGDAHRHACLKALALFGEPA